MSKQVSVKLILTTNTYMNSFYPLLTVFLEEKKKSGSFKALSKHLQCVFHIDHFGRPPV